MNPRNRTKSYNTAPYLTFPQIGKLPSSIGWPLGARKYPLPSRGTRSGPVTGRPDNLVRSCDTYKSLARGYLQANILRDYCTFSSLDKGGSDPKGCGSGQKAFLCTRTGPDPRASRVVARIWTRTRPIGQPTLRRLHQPNAVSSRRRSSCSTTIALSHQCSHDETHSLRRKYSVGSWSFHMRLAVNRNKLHFGL